MNDKPFWQSRTLIGAIITIMAALAGVVGYTIDVQVTTDLFLLAIAGGSQLLVVWGRIKAEKPIRPLPRLSSTPKV